MAISLEREAQIYADLMAEIKGRTLMAKDAVAELAKPQTQEQAANHESVVKAESLILQTRIVAELIALCALVAHSPFGLTKDLVKSWNADKTFRMLEDVNPDCFPRAMTPTTTEGGNTHFQMRDDCLTRQGLAKIYERCGEMLHRGVLKHILKGQPKALDLNFISASIDKMIALLNCHAILLLQHETIIVIFMNAPGQPIHVNVGSAKITEITELQ